MAKKFDAIIIGTGQSGPSLATRFANEGMKTAILERKQIAYGLLREAVMDDPSRLRQSVRDLLELDFEALLVGDGEPILRDAKARLEDLVESFPS